MKFRMLPPVFKIIGIVIILLSSLVLIPGKLNTSFFNQLFADNVSYSRLAISVFFIGFLLFIMAREKVEDEFTNFCRLMAFRITFMFGVVSIILNPIRLFHLNNLDKSYHLLLIQGVFYIIIFYIVKKGFIRYEK